MSDDKKRIDEFERMQRFCLQMQIENAQLKLHILDLQLQIKHLTQQEPDK
jgi:hypothetical protein